MDCSTPGFPVHHQLLAYSNSSQSSQWRHPSISSSVIPFSSHLQSFPASGSFQMSQLFTPSGHSIGVSASVSVLPMNIQDWFPLGFFFKLLCEKETERQQGLSWRNQGNKTKWNTLPYLVDVLAGQNWRWEEKGMTEDERVRWHHWLNGHEFE